MKNSVLIIAQIVAALVFAAVPLVYAKTDCTQVTQIPQVECEALVDLYHSTDGPNWSNNGGWNETNEPCYWFGVRKCEGGHVTELKLYDESSRLLRGAIPESIGNLSNLHYLFLGNNQLTSLPKSIGNLSNLQYLFLGNNQLTSLPESIGNLSSLKELHLLGNQLTSLPESIGNLSSLEKLHLLGNQLTSLPESIGNLSNLQHLSMDSKLTSLPESIGNLGSLSFLDLSNNQLCYLPFSIINLKALTNLNVGNNHLMISDPDLSNWLNQYDSDWIVQQTPVRCGALQPDITSHDFGQLANNQQANQLFTITNTSNETSVHINTVTFTDNQTAEFTQSTDVDHQCTGKTLAPGEVCYEYISFISNSEGEKQAQLVFNSDDPVIPEFNIGLSAGELNVEQVDRACLVETPTLQTINSGDWSDNVWSDMNGNPVSYLPGKNDVILINQGHTIIGLPKIEISALCNRGELRSVVGEPLEIIASNGISNHGSIIGEHYKNRPKQYFSVECGTPGSDVILKAGTRFKHEEYEDWWWVGYGKPIYNNGTIRAGNGGTSKSCGGNGGNILVLGRNITNDYNGVIFAGSGGAAYIPRPGYGGMIQIWSKLGGPGNLVNRGQINAGNSGNKAIPADGRLWLVSSPYVDLGSYRIKADKVTIRANNILTDEGIELTDIIQANEIITEPGQGEVLLTGPSVLIGIPNATTTLTFILTNNGPTADVYDLTISGTNWDLGNTLPNSISLEGLSNIEFDVHVTIPADATGKLGIIKAVATSQTAGNTVSSIAEILVSEVPAEVVEPEKPVVDEVETPDTVKPSGCLLVDENLKILEDKNLFNAILEGSMTNTGWISNLTITPEGHLTGGIVTGYIVNEGLMEDFEFCGMSIIGGTLGGTITNSSPQGYIQDIHLAPNTHLIGGQLHGEITGDEKSPALVEATKIDGKVVLTNLIIGAGTDLAEGVTIGKGVRFANATLIPAGLDFTEALSSNGTLDLNIDIVNDVPSLLEQINQLPDMLANSWQLKQDAETGEYYVMASDVRVVVIPLQVRQAPHGSDVHLTIHPDGVHVTLVTAQEREIHVEIQVNTSP